MTYAGNNLVTHRALKGPRMLGWMNTPELRAGEATLTLRAIQETRGKIDRSELRAVRLARENGMSWTDIATTLGITRQSAWERWHEDIDGSQVQCG